LPIANYHGLSIKIRKIGNVFSLTPGFSPVQRQEKEANRFNGFPSWVSR
jgi:hypothetical protein